IAKAARWDVTDAETRKRGEQTGLDTLVVHDVHDGHVVWGGSTPSVLKLTHQVPRLGSTAASLKLKGIDGGPHKQRSMWFNSTQREEPYLGLTCRSYLWKHRVSSAGPSQVVHGCRQLVS